VVLGSSMEPAFLPGQFVLLHRDYYRTHPVQNGQVVAFRWKGETYVKRVAALQGEKIRLICYDDYSTVLAKELVPTVERLARGRPAWEYRVVTVPEGHFFALGDNVAASLDSRDLGPIPVTAILGRVQSLKARRLP
jgi:signal peptidase I